MLILQIALGVIIGGSVLMWLQRRQSSKAEEQARNKKAYELGQKHGQALSDVVTGQVRLTLSTFQDRLLAIQTERIEGLAVLDETIEQQQDRNRNEVSALRETAKEAETLVWQELQRHQSDWLRTIASPEECEAISELVRQEVLSWRLKLFSAAMTTIADARGRVAQREVSAEDDNPSS